MLLFTMVCATAPALAQPASMPPIGTATTPLPPARTAAVEEDKPFVFAAAHLGINAPFGALGLEAGGGFEFLRGSLSIGRGWRGISVAAMARAVKEVGALDLGLGVGVSRGPGLHAFTSDPSDHGANYGSDTIWLDVEVSAEVNLGSGGFFRGYAGVTGARYFDCVAEDSDTGQATGCDGFQMEGLERDGFLPYFGIAGGFRWPPPPASKPTYTPPSAPMMLPGPMW